MRWSLGLLLLALCVIAVAVPPSETQSTKSSSGELDRAASRAVIEGGLKATVWAAEPLLENPVVFSFDRQGACYVVETNRFKNGVPDTRDHMYWLDDDLAARSVADRVAMYNRPYPGKKTYTGYEKYSEIVRKVWDGSGKGVADRSSIFADGFNDPADGVAAGVLPYKGDVFFACVPSLYRLKDTRGKHQADQKKVVSTGYGIHVQFVGHDLHGLVIGPDGRLYFSIGDRGFKVTTKEGKVLNLPDCGAVLRCETDGSNLEIVHSGLRNPQELAFDNFGNLFTYDNNSDSGDQARWVQIIEGGDSGWRCGYQYGTLMHHAGVPQGNRGPWNTEQIWMVPGEKVQSPAYVVPPLRHFGNGPSGLTFYPGVGLSDRYQDHFFACDFTASAGNSVIWSLAVKPKGASFEVTDLHPFAKNLVPTDCDFGPDGAFYWTDWIGGWDLPKKGRIFRVADEEAMKNPAIGEARKLLAEGMAEKTTDELGVLLGHPHREVRFEAQSELANRSTGVPTLLNVAIEAKNPRTRRHAIWGLGLFQRRNADLKVGIAQFLKDPDATVRSQVVKVLGELGRETDGIAAMLTDADASVRREAVLAYGKRKPQGSDDYKPVFAFLKANNDQDVYLRAAAAQALATLTQQPCDLLTAFDAAVTADASLNTSAVRMGVVLAQRKLQCRLIGRFVNDPDANVAAEAARAIYDQELMNAMEDLAAVAEKPGLSDPLAYRALAANFKLGIHPDRLAKFAGQSERPAHLREFAMKLLAEWPAPRRRDPITGLTQSLPKRDAAEAVAAVKANLTKLLAGPPAVRSATVQTISALNVPDVGVQLLGTVTDARESPSSRIESLFALEQLKASELAEAVSAAMASPDAPLRAAGRVVKAKANPEAAKSELPKLLGDAQATVIEKQMALGVMASMAPAREIDESLAGLLDQLIAGKLPPALMLDVLEAAQSRVASNRRLFAPLKDKLNAYDRQARDGVAKDPLSRYRDVTHGGDAEKGKDLFINNPAVYCQRCHKLAGQGGEVGPELTTIGKDKTRDDLLEAIVDPNKQIAKGFESVILTLDDGRTVSGVLRSKSDKEYVLVDAENKVKSYPRASVEAERPDKSAMPDDLHKKLSRRELRDLVEFLAGRK